MSNTTLRQLAKDHAKGVIDKATYRKARGEFIAGIVDGSIELQENTYLPPVEQDDNAESVTETRNRKKAQIKASPPPSSQQPQQPQPVTPSAEGKKIFSWMGILIGVMTIAILILVGLIFIADTPDELSDSEISTQKAKQTTNITQENKAGNKIIDDFLTQKTWHNDALDNFKSQWNELTPEQTTAILNSAALKRLTNAIHRQLLEEQSLATIGDGQAALQRQEQLIDFASSIGINDPRLAASMIEIKKN